jgi:tetraacyldisaccharide 4'-kinase
MRAILETALNRRWYQETPPAWWLRMLEGVYRRAAARRRVRERALQPRDLAGRPIVVVGNLTAGGTGKTPLIIRLCGLLQAAGLKPGVVSRGSVRRGTALLIVDGSQPPRHSGDEPRLIFDRCGVPVAVSSDRIAATRRLFEWGVDVVLADDGLQHLRLPRSYEICVIDGQRGLGNGHLLPAGPLREEAARLATVDAVVINGATGAGPVLPGAIHMQLLPGRPTRLDGRESLDVDSWTERAAGREIVACAGIGHPQRFFDTLQSLGITHRRCAFPDHHEYTARDFAEMQDVRIIMTEKDAVKCRELGLADAWYLPVDAGLPEDWEQAFVSQVRDWLAAGQGPA